MTSSIPFSLAVDETGEQVAASSHRLELPGGTTCEVCIELDQTDDISRGIASGTYRVPTHYQLLEALVPKPGRVFDLGAHIGTFALYAAAAGHEVLAVEASRRNAALLRESVRRNGFDRVRVVHAAVLDRPGSVDFTEFGLFGVVANPMLQWPAVSTPAVTIDGLMANAEWRDVDFVKMDIEGSEVMALRGMAQLLARDRAPALVFESNGHTLRLFGETPTALLKILDGAGFRSWLIVDRTLVAVQADDLQMVCLADYLSRKGSTEPMPGWHFCPRRSTEEDIGVALASSCDVNPNVRAYIGRILEQADTCIRSDPRVVSALARMRRDDDVDVRAAAAWSDQP